MNDELAAAVKRLRVHVAAFGHHYDQDFIRDLTTVLDACESAYRLGRMVGQITAWEQITAPAPEPTAST